MNGIQDRLSFLRRWAGLYGLFILEKQQYIEIYFNFSNFSYMIKKMY